LTVRIPRSRPSLGALGSALAALAFAAPGASAATVTLNHGCYLVGQSVSLNGAGFAPSASYVVTVDGVYFGTSTTTSGGSLSATFRPGGLSAGFAQAVDHLEATDGTTVGRATFTITRSAGARLLTSGGNPRTLRSRFEIWGFGLDGSHKRVYLHYVSPSGRASTTALGVTRGQCGYLRTQSHRVFPFKPSVGTWTFQFDTSRGYSSHPAGPVARVPVVIQ
jgi:hypothetical protein